MSVDGITNNNFLFSQPVENANVGGTNGVKQDEKSSSIEFKGPVINGKQCPSYEQYLNMTPAEKTSFFELLTRDERATFMSYCDKTKTEAELEKARQKIKDDINKSMDPLRQELEREIQRRLEQQLQQITQEQIDQDINKQIEEITKLKTKE